MKPTLVISNTNEIYCLCAEDIVYIEAAGNYTNIYLVGGEVIKNWCLQIGILATMIDEQLGATFIRIGRSIIANQNYINYINLKKQKLVLRDPYGHKYETDKGSADSLKKLKDHLEKQYATQANAIHGN